MVDFIKMVGGVASAIIASITCIILIFKPIRSKFVNWVKKTSNVTENDKVLIELKNMLQEHIDQEKVNTQIMKLHGEASLCLLRNEITHIYFKYKNSKQLPTYEKENLVNLYDGYKALNGNHYISVIYKEMIGWEVI